MPSIEIKINSKEKTPEEKAKNKKIVHTVLAVIAYGVAVIFGASFLLLHFGTKNQDTTISEGFFALLAIGFWVLGIVFWDKDHAKKKKS